MYNSFSRSSCGVGSAFVHNSPKSIPCSLCKRNGSIVIAGRHSWLSHLVYLTYARVPSGYVRFTVLLKYFTIYIMFNTKTKYEDTEMDAIGVHNLHLYYSTPTPQLWSSVVNVVAVVVEAQYNSKVHSSSYGSIPQADNQSSVLSTVDWWHKSFHCLS